MCDCCNHHDSQTDSQTTTPTTDKANKAELQLSLKAAGWVEASSDLGRTVFRPKNYEQKDTDMSVAIFTKGFHNPHAYPDDHAQFCVEVIGTKTPDYTAYEFFDDHEAALGQVINYISETVPEGVYHQRGQALMFDGNPKPILSRTIDHPKQLTNTPVKQTQFAKEQ